MHRISLKWGSGYAYIQTPRTAVFWHYGPEQREAVVELLPKTNPADPTRARREFYAAGRIGAVVVLYAVERHGRNWPGRGVGVQGQSAER